MWFELNSLYLIEWLSSWPTSFVIAQQLLLDQTTLVMFWLLSCFNSCHVLTLVMFQLLSCFDSCHVSTLVMFQLLSCFDSRHVSTLVMFWLSSCFDSRHVSTLVMFRPTGSYWHTHVQPSSGQCPSPLGRSGLWWCPPCSFAFLKATTITVDRFTIAFYRFRFLQ